MSPEPAEWCWALELELWWGSVSGSKALWLRPVSDSPQASSLPTRHPEQPADPDPPRRPCRPAQPVASRRCVQRWSQSSLPCHDGSALGLGTVELKSEP